MARIDPIKLVKDGAHVRVFNSQDALYAEGRVLAYCDQPTITVEAADGTRMQCPVGMRIEVMGPLQRIEEIVRKASRDPGSICSQRPGETYLDWVAHAVTTALDCRGLLRHPDEAEGDG
jgi:hypothetical protein